MLQIKSDKIKEWIKYAGDNLIAAIHFHNTMEFPIYRVVCFSCQQSAEKYLKACQIYFDLEIVKTHDLNFLIDNLLDTDKNLEQFNIKGKRLSRYAVKYRYPDDFEDLTKANAEDAISIATEIEKYITEKIVL